MEQLPLFFTLRGRDVLLLGSGPAAEAKARLIEGAGGTVVGEIGAARLAFVATDTPETDAARLKAAGLLVNVVDRPDLCDFTVPSIVDRAPVTVAIGTGGASATLAKALRERLEALLPAGLGALAQAVAGARASVKARHPDASDRRRFWDALMAPGAPLDPLGAPDLSAIGGCAPAAQPPRTIRVSDPDQLTLADLRALSTADTVFHTARASAAVLDRARRDAVRVVASALPADLPPGRSVFVES
jgi:uroporphyrin-III C-methyltransferase/precorrin-2 dehydrogenase/sirohydrochlorin ferrochelatase